MFRGLGLRLARAGAASQGVRAEGKNVPEGFDSYSTQHHRSERPRIKVVRTKKSIVKSNLERLEDYLKPTLVGNKEFLDVWELGKFGVYLMVPVVMLLWWKGAFQYYPDRWEKMFAHWQAPRDDPTSASSIGNKQGMMRKREQVEEDRLTGQQSFDTKGQSEYFDVIGDFEKKRTAALLKAGIQTEYGGAE